MKNLSVFLLVLVTLWGCSATTDQPKQPAQAADGKQVGLRFGRVVDFNMLAGDNPAAPSKTFDLDAAGLPAVEKEGVIYSLGKNTDILAEHNDLKSFFFCGPRLVIYTGRELLVNEGQGPQKLLELADPDALFAGNQDRFYIVTRGKDGASNIFMYKFGAGHAPALRLEEPVDSVALDGNQLYFSIGPGVYSVQPGGQAREEATLFGFPKIDSMAVAPGGDIIYFSADNAIYALVRGVAEPIIVNVAPVIGGKLRLHQDNLYVFSLARNGLFLFQNLNTILTTKDHPALAIEKFDDGK